MKKTKNRILVKITMLTAIKLRKITVPQKNVIRPTAVLGKDQKAEILNRK